MFARQCDLNNASFLILHNIKTVNLFFFQYYAHDVISEDEYLNSVLFLDTFDGKNVFDEKIQKFD